MTDNPQPKLVFKSIPNPVPKLMKNRITPKIVEMKRMNFIKYFLKLRIERTDTDKKIAQVRDIPELTYQRVFTN